MSFTILYDIWCENCGKWERGGSNVGKRALRRLVRAKGWSYVRGVGDLCKPCTEWRNLNG